MWTIVIETLADLKSSTKLYKNNARPRPFCRIAKRSTVKALLSPRGAYLILNLPEEGLNREGGLLERGGLFTKSSEKDIFGSFSVPLFPILRIQHTIFRLKYTDSTQFLSHIILKLTCKVV